MNSSKLGLELNTKEPEYLLGSQILLYLVLRNKSDLPAIVNCRLRYISGHKFDEWQDIYFTVIRPNGRIARPRLRTLKRELEPDKQDFVIIKPQSSYTRKIDLSAYYSFKESGLYLVSALYHNQFTGSKFGYQAWTGQLQSEQLRIDILPKEVV